MARPRLCSECGQSLAGRKANAKTCSPNCRQKRSRRLASANADAQAEAALPDHVKEIRQAARGERDDVVDRVLQEELRPVVRESITDDTLKAIRDLIALTPEAVAAIQEDLASEDATIRQKAYTLIARYTIGHPAIVRPPEEEADKQLIVHFNIPRPEQHGATEEPEVIEAESAVPLHDDELRQCDMCGADKPITDFVAGSHRCVTCYEAQQEKARNLYSDGDD